MTDKKNCFAGQNIKKRAFGKMLFLCAALFFTVVVFTQCDWFAPAEYVRVHTYNKTAEPLSVSTGKTFLDVIIPADADVIISVVKGVRISAIGKTSGNIYATRTFYRDNEVWIINR
ncbi:hypothetical protein H0R92_06180 [Treponema sp. OMZ 840]|uniref:hypothetical protein n=1 Tax=Treponema sp. OMZ 840 TaxID=244313 RepID=UPI003D9248EA